jgi:type IV pilus assembly protein PilC
MTHEHLLLFTRQLATLVSAGVPLLQALQTIAEGIQHPPSKAQVVLLQQQIAQGQSLHQALENSAQFDRFYCQLIAAGEISGQLDDMLERLVLHLNRQHQLRKTVRGALVYPLSVLLIAVLVVAVILIWVVPVFQSIFASFGAELPMATQLVLRLSDGFSRWGWLWLLGCAGLFLLLRQVHRRSASFQMFWSFRQLNWPVMGALQRLANLAIWTRCMSTLVRAGVPLLDSLAVTAGVCPNPWFGLASVRISHAVTRDKPWLGRCKICRKTLCFPKTCFRWC